MNISLGFVLEGPVSEELVLRAWDTVKKQYTYFSSTLQQDDTGGVFLVQNEVPERS